jgi:two-component system, NtrC family, nitrogen regulation sensor histidine kinase NtrY
LKPLLKNRFFLKLSLLVAAIVLFALSFIFNKLYTNRSAVAEEASNAEDYIHRMQGDFDELLRDSALVDRLINNTAPVNEFTHTVNKQYGVFLYNVSDEGVLSLRFWSNQLILPPPGTYSSGDMEEFMNLSNGNYLVVKRTLHFSSRTIVAYAMIPIRSFFFLETNLLPERFAYSDIADSRVVISQTVTDFPVRSVSGKILFYFDKKLAGGVPYNNKLTILLRLGGLLFLLLFVHLVAESFAASRIWLGVVFLGVILLTIRMIIYWWPGLLNLRQFELFDPSIYGSNFVQRSLGDLLMNSVFFCWLVLFTWSKVHHEKNTLSSRPPWLQWTVGIISICLLIYSTFILSSLIRSIVADSKISFDVTNFDSLDRYTAVGFIVLACLSLSYYYFTQLLFRNIFPVFRDNPWPVYFAIGFSGLTYLTIKSGDPTVLFYLPVLAWLLLYTWVVSREGMILSRIRINIAGILFWIFVFSVSIAAIMLAENKKVEQGKRRFYAEKLADQTDPSSERLMSIALKYLDNDFLEGNFYRLTDSLRSRQMRDSILEHIYSGYSNRFETRLYVYDTAGNALFNRDRTTFEALNTIVTQQSRPTATPDLFYYETSFDKITYITKRAIGDSLAGPLGYLFIVSNPKKYSSDALFPELFRQYKENSPENSPIYSYAVYSKRKLVSYSNKYPFPTRLDGNQPNGNDEFQTRINGEYNELWYRAANERVVVIVRKRDTIIETITLFSYIFCSFLFLVFVVQVLSLILKAVNDWDDFKRFFHFNIRNQVHTTIIFISIFSFIIIGIATINFFKTRYNRNNTERLSRTVSIMVNEIRKKIQSDSASTYNLQSLVNEVSDIHGVDVNVYDLQGDLQVSSETDVYNRGVLSTKMHPLAYYHLNRLNQVEHVQQERIADFGYLNVYAPVRDDDDGTVYFYLSVPYFMSQSELNQEISNFIVTVINLNAFILLTAGLIALFVTNRITRSFSVISDKMKDVNLGRLNEEIVWNRNDEIGDLVTEYNKMVAKLGESAKALAKTEREGAWREMARQVAHEIKNPLTPMKLSIQYLQKAIDSNQPNVKELSGNVANTLVEQIDHLSKIAADFSQFANIGNIRVEEFNLHLVLRSLQELYRSDPNIEFSWYQVHRPIIIRADKTQMNRLFTNLFANAIEACKDRFCRIEVHEQILDGFVRISVKDNGEGIDAVMQSRIFLPNFTTKSSGTGLGLAMCKSIVEQANGKIWFETEKGVGTIFFVELPLVG